MKILVTGVAGFIGSHVAKRLHASGHAVVGLDNINGYYDVRLKNARLEKLSQLKGFEFARLDLSDRTGMAKLFSSRKFDKVIHLGAQAGVRYSIDNPFAYIDSNITGMLAVLEGCRFNNVGHLIYASSSSVYGANRKSPFSVEDRVDEPISLYAATKKSNELMAHTYAHLYGFPVTGLRFFTVYGPWGRPDMAYFKFTNAILAGKAIDIYNHGDMLRDFTYIDDIVTGIESIVDKGPVGSPGQVAHKVYNLGNRRPEKLLHMVEKLEDLLGVKAQKNFLPMQPGDVYSTCADISETARDYLFDPVTNLDEGLAEFVRWYRDFYAEAT